MNITEAIRLERARQDVKWGRDSILHRTQESGLRVLVEEVGEVAKGINERDRDAVREELVQVAAVAVAMLEALNCDGRLVGTDK